MEFPFYEEMLRCCGFEVSMLDPFEPKVVVWQPGGPPHRVHTEHADMFVAKLVWLYATKRDKKILELLDLMLRGMSDEERFAVLTDESINLLDMAMGTACYSMMKMLLMHGAPVPAKIADMTAVNAGVTTLAPIPMAPSMVDYRRNQISLLILQLHLLCPLQLPDEPYFVTNRRKEGIAPVAKKEHECAPEFCQFEKLGYRITDVFSITVRAGSFQPLYVHVNALMEPENKSAFSNAMCAIEYVEIFAELGGLPTTMLPHMAGSALHVAITFGHAQIVNVMLRKWNLHGPSLNYFSRHGDTPLVLAAKLREVKILEMLLKRNACAAILSLSLNK